MNQSRKITFDNNYLNYKYKYCIPYYILNNFPDLRHAYFNLKYHNNLKSYSGINLKIFFSALCHRNIIFLIYRLFQCNT